MSSSAVATPLRVHSYRCSTSFSSASPGENDGFLCAVGFTWDYLPYIAANNQCFKAVQVFRTGGYLEIAPHDLWKRLIGVAYITNALLVRVTLVFAGTPVVSLFQPDE